jgi:glutathione synthase/RimK-type ligase-like ATP-grasp enzyme
VHGAEVMARLHRQRGNALMFDTGAFPRQIGLTLEQPAAGPWGARARIDGAESDLTDARVVWWRRPRPPLLHEDLAATSADQMFAYNECHAAIAGLWSALDAHWVNDPERDLVASRKVVQLKRAVQLGMRVPRTCITNDPTEAAAFVEAEGADRTIYKSFLGTEEAWRETRLLRPDEQALLDNVRFAPVIFQEFIPAAVDVRVTVVGDDLFAAAIRSQETRYPHDFRMDLEAAPIEPHVLPDDECRQLLALTASFGLVYGAIDLRLTPEGEYVFLEINPAGQWLFIELRTGQPITDALVGHLIAHD